MTFRQWIRKVYGLFVEDPVLAAMSMVTLAIVFLLSHMGLTRSAGLVLFVLIAASIMWSVLRAYQIKK